MNGPQKEVEGQTPHHQDQPSTSSFSSDYATLTTSDYTGHRAEIAGRNSAVTRQCAETDMVTCSRCGRPLTARLSVLYGAGAVCRRHIFEGELANALHSCADDLAVTR
jgi:hypothetical protein